MTVTATVWNALYQGLECQLDYQAEEGGKLLGGGQKSTLSAGSCVATCQAHGAYFKLTLLASPECRACDSSCSSCEDSDTNTIFSSCRAKPVLLEKALCRGAMRTATLFVSRVDMTSTVWGDNNVELANGLIECWCLVGDLMVVEETTTRNVFVHTSVCTSYVLSSITTILTCASP